MKNKLRIGLDIDGVLAEFEQHFLTYLSLPTHGAEHWDDPRFKDNFHRVSSNLKFWLTMPRIFDPKLLKFKPTLYCTARPIATEVTKFWLKSKGFPDVPVITVGHNGSKVSVLRGKVDLFIEDAIHNYEELNNNGVRCVLVTRSHNVNYDAGEDRFEDLLDFQNKYLDDSFVIDNYNNADLPSV